MDFTAELAKYGPSGIALGLVILIFYLVKLFLDFAKCSMEQGQKTTEHLRLSIDRNTKVSEETYRYLKNRNGHLEEILKEKRNDKH